MIWLVFAIAAAVLVGSAFLAGRDPRFWWGMGLLAWEHIKPGLTAAIARDFSPANTARVAEATRQGLNPALRGRKGPRK